jgi:hypothetical protein
MTSTRRSRPSDVTCKVCGLTGPSFPDGWYQLTVNDTTAPNGKYRYLGVFCSIVCLAQHMPEMARVETVIQRSKEHSR